MPYRPLTLKTPDGRAETHWVRISADAVATWLTERAYLRARGYPDRPPDVDTRTLRAWVPRRGDERLAYFRDQTIGGKSRRDRVTFPVYTVTWHTDVLAVKVIVTGYGDGAFLSRVRIEGPGGEATVDKCHRYPPEADPAVVWAAIEVIIRFINESPVGRERDGTLVTDYGDYVALDAEVDAAEADARASGFILARRLDA